MNINEDIRNKKEKRRKNVRVVLTKLAISQLLGVLYNQFGTI